MKNYLWMSSAAVVIGALKVNLNYSIIAMKNSGFTWNIKSYFLWKTMKKYLWLSSAAFVIGAWRVNLYYLPWKTLDFLQSMRNL